MPPARRRDAIATRERLVRAAVELFTAEGYQATTTIEIANRARTAEATIYRHFSGKEALFNEAYRDALRTGLALLAADPERGPARDRLGRLGRRVVERAVHDPALVTLLFQRIDPRVLDEQSQSLQREFRAAVAQVIAGGKQEGTVRAGSADLWSAVWLTLVGFVVERITGREWSLEHPSVGQTLDAAWSAIGYRADRSVEPGL
jgi:AcrR family transcriptional regulator